MANSIKEYIAGTNADGTTYPVGPSFTYPTPDYLEGRGDTDIVVYVDDILQSSDKYTVNGTALNFHVNAVPSVGARIQIKRTSSRDQRLTDYTDGALLNAETLDKDSDQLFYMAQEALDTSNFVNIGSSQFYYSQDLPPENPKLGTLWYHLNNHANELKVWDGNEWSLATPVKETKRYTKDDFTEVVGDTDKLENVELNSSSEVYLNGVKLIKGSNYAEVVTDQTADYWYDADQYQLLWMKDIAADDIIEIITFTGGYATTVAEAEARINQLVTDAEGYAIASGNINLNINEDFAELVKFSSNPEDESFEFQDAIHFSALHHAAKAAESAGTANAAAFSASTHLANTEKYANHPEDSEFTDSLGRTGYSALHYYEKTKEQAEAATEASSNVSGQIDQLTADVSEAAQAKSDAEAAQGKAEDAQGLAEDARDTAVSSKDLAQKYADSDAVFDVDGVPTKSAKMIKGEIDVAIGGIDQKVIDANEDIEAAVDAASVLSDSLLANVNNPAHQLIDPLGSDPYYSSRHWAEIAEQAANVTVDSLQGWELKDANTIRTTTNGKPVFHSSTTLDLKATEAVLANDVPLPIFGGSVNLSTSSVKGFKGTSISKNGDVFKITFDTPFGFSSDYQVMATYNGNNKAVLKVDKTKEHFTVEACTYDYGANIDTGEIVVTVYKFT